MSTHLGKLEPHSLCCGGVGAVLPLKGRNWGGLKGHVVPKLVTTHATLGAYAAMAAVGNRRRLWVTIR